MQLMIEQWKPENANTTTNNKLRSELKSSPCSSYKLNIHSLKAVWLTDQVYHFSILDIHFQSACMHENYLNDETKIVISAVFRKNYNIRSPISYAHNKGRKVQFSHQTTIPIIFNIFFWINCKVIWTFKGQEISHTYLHVIRQTMIN